MPFSTEAPQRRLIRQQTTNFLLPEAISGAIGEVLKCHFPP